MQKIWVRSLGWEDPLEEGTTTHTNMLAWKIPVDRGAWRAADHGVTKSWARLSGSKIWACPSGCVRACYCWVVTESRLTLLWTHGLLPIRLLCPWDFPGKDIGVGCHFLLQGIFPTQGSNPSLLHAGRWTSPTGEAHVLWNTETKQIKKKSNHIFSSKETANANYSVSFSQRE